jgi:E3 ubiquitin-protein ligase ATL6/9/15/31/42/55
VIDTSILSSTGGARVLFTWLGWGALCLVAAALGLIALAVVAEAVAQEAARRHRQPALARRKREQRLRRRQRCRMMSSLRDAPYEQLIADGMVRNPCVICRGEYEVGETCSLLPLCTHTFDKHCIAAWLRHHTTCPICNAAVARSCRCSPTDFNFSLSPSSSSSIDLSVQE